MTKIEATVAACKCKEMHKSYGVRFERISQGHWKYTWAFPLKEDAAKREGYDATIIDGVVEPDIDYPGCPYCGTKYFVVCECGKLNCNVSNGNTFTCEWCGLTGTHTNYGGDRFSGKPGGASNGSGMVSWQNAGFQVLDSGWDMWIKIAVPERVFFRHIGL